MEYNGEDIHLKQQIVNNCRHMHEFSLGLSLNTGFPLGMEQPRLPSDPLHVPIRRVIGVDHGDLRARTAYLDKLVIKSQAQKVQQSSTLIKPTASRAGWS